MGPGSKERSDSKLRTKSAEAIARPYPNRGPLRGVEDFEMRASLVNYPPRDSIQRVYLADNDALADAAKARVAGADPQVVDLGSDERRPRACPSCGRARLGPGMAAADDDYVERPEKMSAGERFDGRRNSSSGRRDGGQPGGGRYRWPEAAVARRRRGGGRAARTRSRAAARRRHCGCIPKCPGLREVALMVVEGKFAQDSPVDYWKKTMHAIDTGAWPNSS